MADDMFFYGNSGGGNFMESVIPIMFFIVFCLVIATFIKVAVSGISEWNRNNKQPIIPINATVVSKRLDVSYHHNTHNENMNTTTSSTTYYVTFEFENSERLELHVKGKDYGSMVEGDFGVLSFQGTRFISFKRKI